MGKKKSVCSYNPDWENPQLFPDLATWVQPVHTDQRDDGNYFSCKICNTGRLYISTMGVQALRSHMADRTDKETGRIIISKHNKNIKATKITKPDFFKAFGREEPSLVVPPQEEEEHSQESMVIQRPATAAQESSNAAQPFLTTLMFLIVGGVIFRFLDFWS